MSDSANLPKPLTPDFSSLATVRGLQVIVTRPLAQATPWVEALRAHGHEAHAVPLIDLEPVADVKPLRKPGAACRRPRW